MAILKAFKGWRPPQSIVKDLASRPYDVLDSHEARIEADGNPYSLLHIIKPEIDLDPSVNLYSQEVYDKARQNFDDFRTKGWLVMDHQDCLYIYAQTMNGKTQYGIVGCAGVEDYMNNVIKKHELTRPDKEEDRMKHVRITDANMEPVFFSYPANPRIDSIVVDVVNSQKPEYDFIADDGFGHHFWTINNQAVIEEIINIFATFPATYVADGHHRTAAAALVGNEKRKLNPNHTGKEEYNFFLAVHFPDNQLTIIDYNRLVKDLNGMTVADFLDKLKNGFEIEPKGSVEYKPNRLHNFGMFLDGQWYSLTAKPGTYDDSDPIGVLDVTILTKLILEPLLDITDQRRSKRIDFVGGIRGLGELSKRVNEGGMAVAFALFPVSMQQLINIADSGNIMPPKTTWFEPKLRSGLVVHTLH